MTFRQWIALIGIATCVFVFNMSEFMPIGLLTDISADLSVSESTTGLIISVYAWAVAILSLPLMLLFRKMEYKRLLVLCVALFTVFQFLSGISSNFMMLMVSRLGVAVAHSVFWSIASPMAVRAVPIENRKMALSVMAAGTSIAMIVGLPIGRIIGLAMGWRMTFIVMMAVSLALCILLIVSFPRMDNPGTFTLRRLPSIFTNRAITGIYVIIIVYVLGYYTGYSYIEPFLGQITGLSESMITVILTVFGLAGIVGSYVFTRTDDKHRYTLMAVAISGVAISMMMVWYASASMVTVTAMCCTWGMFSTCLVISLQSEMLRVTPEDASAIAMSLFSGLFNVGIASGSLLGGYVTDTVGIANITSIGMIFVILALIFFLAYLKRVLIGHKATYE